jgi:Protein of unknown function (DUF3102)
MSDSMAVNTVATRGSNRLPMLTATILEHITASETAVRYGFEHAAAAGQLLLEARELVPSDQWETWLREQCRLSLNSARVYMRLARNKHRIEALAKNGTKHLSIGAATFLIAKPRPKYSTNGLPGQLDLFGGPEVPAKIPSSPFEPVGGRWGKRNLIAVLSEALETLNNAPQTKAFTLYLPLEQQARVRAAIETVLQFLQAKKN